MDFGSLYLFLLPCGLFCIIPEFPGNWLTLLTWFWFSALLGLSQFSVVLVEGLALSVLLVWPSGSLMLEPGRVWCTPVVSTVGAEEFPASWIGISTNKKNICYKCKKNCREKL